MGIISRLGGINPYKSLYHSLKPRSGVYCFKLNFNISKLGYSHNIPPEIHPSKKMNNVKLLTFKNKIKISVKKIRIRLGRKHITISCYSY